MANAAYDIPKDHAQTHDLGKLGLYWKDQLERAARYYKAYLKRCADIENIYLMQGADQASGAGKRKFPLLWANTSVLQPAVYARTPQPAVERRFKDAQPIARTASELIERNLTFLMDAADIDTLMREVRDDFLLVGRGVAWLRYEADIEPTDIGVLPSGSPEFQHNEAMGAGQAETDQGQPSEQITDERICVDYVHWSDFLNGPARRWKDVPWVGRAVWMDEDEIEERFGKDALNSIAGEALKTGSTGKSSQERAENEGKTRVWEIWCKSENYAVWIADGSPVALEVSDPPLDLQDFWPCPRPAFATVSTGSIIPVPDYVYYQGQCEEIDRLTQRITNLTDQLRLKGFYPSADGKVSPAIERAMKPDNDTILVPVDSWSAFAEAGGAKVIVWLPIEEIQKVIVACIEARKVLMDDVYQITGISDIVRGDTEAQETLGAQRIKAQWGQIRIRDRQAEIARFARDIVRMAGEIICKTFQPETLMQIAAMPLPSMQEKQQAQIQMQMQQMQQAQAQQQQMPPQPGQPPAPPQAPQQPPMDPKIQQILSQPAIEEVMGLLRDDNTRGFRIDIETDSTIEPDEDAEKQRRMEFAQVLGQFLNQAGPIAQSQPELVPVMGETMLFVARGFRAGRQLESSLEQLVQQLSQKAANPAPPQPSPDEMIKLQTVKVKADAEQTKAKLELAQAQATHHAGMEQMRSDAAVQQLQQHQEMVQQQAAQAQQAQAHQMTMQQGQQQMVHAQQAHEHAMAQAQAAAQTPNGER